jgi:putative acetyltransferase
MTAAATVHRTNFDDRLPWLAGLHTPEEDQAFFSTIVFDRCEVWGAFQSDILTGFIAFTASEVEHLFVLPTCQDQGIGSKLLAHAQSRRSALSLWTFQRNSAARRFYERRGFVATEQTDGSQNEEREPDIRYVWSAPK